MDFKFNVSMSGPLLNGAAPGIAGQMISAATEHLTETARDTVLGYSSEFKSHPTWQWEMNLTGVQTSGQTGRVYDTVPYTAWLEGVSSRNMTSRFKGYHMWKLSAAWLQQTAGHIAQTVVAAWMPALGGRGLHAPGGGMSMPPMRAPQRAAAGRGWVPWENSRFDPDRGRR